MKIETLSIVAGSEACNARCPFCVSKMTPARGMTLKSAPINWNRFDTALNYAKAGNTSTAMITSKGEPTLFPDDITGYLSKVKDFQDKTGFSFESTELQTNGIYLMQKPDLYDPLLKDWSDLGLNLAAISIVHFDPEKNRQIYLPYAKEYIDLPGLIKKLHRVGISTRLACVLVDDFLDSPEKIQKMIDFAKTNAVEQLTLRPVNKPEDTRNKEVFEWISGNFLPGDKKQAIEKYIREQGKEVKTFPFGGVVFDINGQNVCLTNSLTPNTDPDYFRQIIFYPEGIIATDWTEGGKLLE